ncbi:CCA tRNA nucleotidyltransferase [Tractidigestivibacter montrealensis]|uniref:HD domain-containing protein n=1 Tax=Tractidigestivibacter montrealensis TaxID=2972466 RepID=A0ABT1Z7A1_9ACTN|nr:HD domain-containing protein [Tractidigestivibacter montrealensis]MCR9036089.1 HD domain-containing protein [Tractidigestivibacter montrealensis]
MRTVRVVPAYPVPDYGLRVLRALEDAGFETWVVGGWVRDALLGAPMHDVDVTTSAPWQETERVLRAAGIEVHETGTAHGTVTAVIDGQPVEVTTYRVEGTYSDRRHPDEVRFVRDVREDLARRDFTVNAMAYHPDRGLLDLFGGREDLSRGVVRAVGDPYRRFEEDALRVLRAVRFACRLGFEVEPRTQAALVACAPELDGIARERVGQEMDGIVASGHVSWALNNEFDVLARAVPALIPMRGMDQRSPYHAYDLLEHTARVCAGVEAFSGGAPMQALRWAALLHDAGKPMCASVDENGRGHFRDHQRAGAILCKDALLGLALPHEVADRAAALVRYHDRHLSASPAGVRRLLRRLDQARPGEAPALAYQLLDLQRADAIAKAWPCAQRAVELDVFERALSGELSRGTAFRVRDLAVGGGDVMRALGVAPGPEVGQALSALLDDVIYGRVENSREALLAWLYEKR